MIEVFVAGAGLLGPGLAGWKASVPVLTGNRPLLPEPPTLPPPALLAPNERRRTGIVVRLALAVAAEAADMAGVPPAAMTSVFASADGDGALIHAILEQLARPEPQVSPTQFHNSVHNAAAGYWSIGTGANRAASCLGCGDATAAAALLRAGAEVAAEGGPVLLCLHDAPMPAPLSRVRPNRFIFGAALVLASRPGPWTLGRLRLDWRCDPIDVPSIPKLPALRMLHAENPAAGLLPVLEALAGGTACVLALPLLDGQVVVEVTP